MDTAGVWQISLADLEVAVRTADPAALLLPGRILRRVIKQDRHIPGAGLRVPHRKSYLVARDRLLQMVYPDELGLGPTDTLPDTVILIARPDAEKLNAMTRGRALVKYWRLLFHAKVHAALDARIAEGRLTLADVRQRFNELGDTVQAEIRDVLDHDEWLLPPADDETLYVEFAAVFFELRHFAPRLLPDYFPTISDFDAVASMLQQDVDAAALFEQTRLRGAPNPEDFQVVDDDESNGEQQEGRHAASPRKQSEQAYCRYMEQADRARSRGNLVRSAMRRVQAGLVIGPKAAKAARREAHSDLDKLARRLQAALDLSDDDCERWSTSLNELMPHAIEGLRSAEARILNDIQKVCIDHERGVYSIDLVGWALSRGKQSLRRPLPCLREVSISKHLHSAAARLGAARLSVDARRRLSQLFDVTQKSAEAKLRGTLRPRIEKAFNAVELRPSNVPESVAREKLIEELLDAISDRGYLTLGDLRDAISRNNLKARDLYDWREAFGSDQLLQVDRRLAESLEGVYRRGELYRRVPQALSSLAFGTPRGRYLTRFGIVPFGGAFLILEFVHHLFHMFLGEPGHEEQVASIPFSERIGDLANHTAQVLMLGTFLLGVLYSPTFRERVLNAARTFWNVAWGALVVWPRRLLAIPLVQTILNSAAFTWCRRFVFKPALLTLALLAMKWIFSRHEVSWTARIGVFVAVNLLLNSRIGRNVDELVTDWAVRGWHQLRIRVFAAAFQFIVDLFGTLLSALERLLYTVDEWFRFRREEPRPVTVFKAVFGVMWRVVTFVVRFCVTLLIEPQVNPIKHFPVVTVSHKMLLPMALTTHTDVPSPLASILMSIVPLSAETANYLMLTLVWGIPGIFGFLVWEFKENWRLFAANRPARLKPVTIGSHGETMSRLLRPGFHSGTLHRIFARLRRADRKAYVTGHWAASRKLQDRLHHVIEEIRHFVDRELIALLNQTRLWPADAWHVGEIHVGLRRVAIPVYLPAPDEASSHQEPSEALWLRFEDRSGWLLASMSRPAWLQGLSPVQLQSLATALAGLLKLAGAQVLRNVIDDVHPDEPLRFELTETELVLRDAHGDQTRYEFDDAAVTDLVPPASSGRWPTLKRQELLCGEIAISWHAWVEAWQRPRDEPIAPPLDDCSMLVDAEVSHPTES